MALRISVGLESPTLLQKSVADMAPRVNGVAQPDGTIDISDVVLILRQMLGM